MEIHDSDLKSVLNKDGVKEVVITEFENRTTTNVYKLREQMGMGSWAARLIYNDRFGGVLIQQQPGEGNRLHYHENDDECWVILAGEWEWYIEGEGTQRVSEHDVVVVRKGVKHRISCVGNEPGMRLAITKPDVDHIYPAD